MNLFNRYNVDSLLANFSKHATRLEKAMHYHDNKAAEATAEASRLTEQAKAAIEQSVRAARTASKIRGLIS